MGSLELKRRAQATMAEEYGARFWRILPWAGQGPSDDGVGLAVVAPGARTEPHSHPETEYFFVVSGRGRAWVEQDSEAIAPGDVLAVAPSKRHHFENASAHEPLEILCLWTLAGSEAGRESP